MKQFLTALLTHSHSFLCLFQVYYLMLWILLFYHCLLLYQCKADLLTSFLNFPKSYDARLLVSFTRNDTQQGELLIGWEGASATASSFETRPEITKAVYYSLNDNQKYVISDWSKPVCIASELDRATAFLNVLRKSSFNLIQVLTANPSYFIGSCKKTGNSGTTPCISFYKCLLDPADSGYALISVSKCQSFDIRQINLHTRDAKPVRFVINHFYRDWKDNDWRASSPDGSSMAFIEQHFVTPSMVYCSGRRSGLKMQQLPNFFSMRVEEVHSHEPDLRKTAYKVTTYCCVPFASLLGTL